MTAIVESICVGQPREAALGAKVELTSIFKSPVSGRVRVDFENIEGDRQANLSVHGGRDKAVYLYSADHYPYWSDQLGRETLEPSQFGENLTVSGIVERETFIGATYRVGTCVVRVTQPRIPCFKLGIRLQDKDFPRRFLDSGRPGFYLRVEEEGEIAVGDPFEFQDRPDHGISVHKLWQTVFGAQPDPLAAAQCLDVLDRLDEGWLRRLRLATRLKTGTGSMS